jgi:hypothetical protein
MRIGEMRCMGVQVWPPQWSSSNQAVKQEAILTDVRTIIGTDLLRIDVDHNGIPHLGILLAEKGSRDSLYHKLKENVGIRVAEIPDLEVEVDQEAAGLRAVMG